jgi:hypothetical protein
MKFSPEYLAGFADADGGISKNSILITNTEIEFLRAITYSLAQYGIHSSIWVQKSKNPRHSDAGRLRIYGFPNLVLFAAKIRFRLRRKQEALLDILRPMCAKGKLYCLDDHFVALKQKEAGKSIRAVGRLLEISQGTINDRFRKKLWPLDDEIVKVIVSLGLSSSMDSYAADLHSHGD